MKNRDRINMENEIKELIRDTKNKIMLSKTNTDLLVNNAFLDGILTLKEIYEKYKGED
jgi:hypothetical protein